MHRLIIILLIPIFLSVSSASAYLEEAEETVEVVLAKAQAYRAAGRLDDAVENLQRAVAFDRSQYLTPYGPAAIAVCG